MLKPHKYSKVLMVGIFLGILIGLVLVGMLAPTENNYPIELANIPIQPAASTNPSSPTSLLDDSALNEYYSSGYSYYYRTGYASSSNYHVVWVQPSDYSDDYDMYLYSDSTYSYSIESSVRGAGALDWVVARPTSSQYYYPKVQTYGTGYAYIEWEDSSSSLSVDDSVSAYLDSYECIEIYKFSLSSSKTYTLTLDVPTSGDYDLYLYYMYYGESKGSSEYEALSATYGSGQDESISSFKPTYSDDYVVIVTRSYGSGSFTLSLKEDLTMSPGAIFLIVLGILATIGISAGVYKKYSGQPRPAQLQRPVQITTPVIKPESPKFEPLNIIRKTPQYITCPYCQSKNDINGLFCSQCGSEL